MSNDISGFGLRINIVASQTFPAGVDITQFADDADPVDLASIQIRDKAMGVNGDLITWSKGVPVPMVIGIIPGSDDDLNLQTLLEANRTGKGKQPARDVIVATITYPDGSVTTLDGGAITDGMPARSVASAGRQKSRTYAFAFENINNS